MTNLEKVHFYFKDLESPAHFITWDYLFMIASCLGRRVWFQSQEFGLYPNIYLIIVGPPAVGKSLPANRLTKILSSLVDVEPGKPPRPIVNITPDCVTLESLYEFIESSTRTVSVGGGEFYLHASVSFMLGDEIGILFKQKETTSDLANFLNKGYDCGDMKYHTKTKGKNEIKNMCVNFLGCCTPQWITRMVGSDLIQEGWPSRCIFLWGGEKRQTTTFINISKEQIAAMEEVKKHFRTVAKLYGPVSMSPEAHEYFHAWYQNFKTEDWINKDPKLVPYYGRKKTNILKLAMCLHFMEKVTSTIDLEDVKGALKLSGEAELNMHKALAVKVNNPLAELAERIRKLISEQPGITGTQILLRSFDGGNLNQISECLKYLLETEQIAGETKRGFKCLELGEIYSNREDAVYLNGEGSTASYGGLVSPSPVCPPVVIEQPIHLESGK